jgi:hypothetical protein
MATGTGLNVSKVNAYAVLTNNTGLNVSKTNAYAVLVILRLPVWPPCGACTGVVGYAYSWSITPSDAASIALTSGSLPPGLALSGTTTATVSGIPTTAGTYTFTLTATNALGSTPATFSITILPAAGGGGAWTFLA